MQFLKFYLYTRKATAAQCKLTWWNWVPFIGMQASHPQTIATKRRMRAGSTSSWFQTPSLATKTSKWAKQAGPTGLSMQFVVVWWTLSNRKPSSVRVVSSTLLSSVMRCWGLVMLRSSHHSTRTPKLGIRDSHRNWWYLGQTASHEN